MSVEWSGSKSNPPCGFGWTVAHLLASDLEEQFLYGLQLGRAVTRHPHGVGGVEVLHHQGVLDFRRRGQEEHGLVPRLQPGVVQRAAHVDGGLRESCPGGRHARRCQVLE
jgi:hypothetical protein